MKKTKGNYKILAPLDKAMKNEYTGVLWEAIGQSHPAFMPVIVKGVKIMKRSEKTQPDLGVVIFFNFKGLGMAYARMFGFDKTHTLAETKEIFSLTLELSQKFKLKTDLICLFYETQGYPIRFDWINYDAVNDRMYGTPTAGVAEELNYLKGPLVLSSLGSDQIVSIYTGGLDGYYVETKDKPETRRFVTIEEAINELNAQQLSAFKKMQKGSSFDGKE